MNELMIIGTVSELVDPLLGDFDPIALFFIADGFF
jgi:hypothetical protein